MKSQLQILGASTALESAFLDVACSLCFEWVFNSVICLMLGLKAGQCEFLGESWLGAGTVRTKLLFLFFCLLFRGATRTKP